MSTSENNNLMNKLRGKTFGQINEESRSTIAMLNIGQTYTCIG